MYWQHNLHKRLPTLLTFVALPLALGAPVTFARLSRASFMSHLLAPPPCRAGPSPWLALWYGMVSHWLSGHFLEYSPKNFFSNLKQHYSAALGLGALLRVGQPGASISPKAMTHAFFPGFRFPSVSGNFSEYLGKFSEFYLFPSISEKNHFPYFLKFLPVFVRCMYFLPYFFSSPLF